MQIFILSKGRRSDREILGPFTTLEKAQEIPHGRNSGPLEWREHNSHGRFWQSGDWFIEEFELE